MDSGLALKSGEVQRNPSPRELQGRDGLPTLSPTATLMDL